MIIIIYSIQPTDDLSIYIIYIYCCCYIDDTS